MDARVKPEHDALGALSLSTVILAHRREYPFAISALHGSAQKHQTGAAMDARVKPEHDALGALSVINANIVEL